MWFEADDASSIPVGQTIEATLEWRGPAIGPLFGSVVRSRTSDREWCFQIDMRHLDFDAASAMLVMLDELLASGEADQAPDSSIVAEEITDVERVRRVVRALSVLSERATLRGPGVFAQVRLADVENDELVWRLDAPASDASGGPYIVEMNGYNSVYSMELSKGERRNGAVVTPMPASVRRLRRRVFRRAFPAEPTNIRFLHPRWLGEGLCNRPIRDVSFGGLSFFANIREDVLFPGLRIPLMTLPFEGDIIRLSAIVRSMTRLGDGAYICGLSVAPWSADDEGPWIRFVAGELSPATQTSDSLLEALWDLFESSGYFSLAGKRPEDFAELRNSFFRLGRRNSDMPQLICQSVWPSHRGVEGTLSCLKAYSKSWMGHQLAKRNGHEGLPEGADAGKILRDVYTSAFERPQTDNLFEWLVCYVEPTVRWVARSHLGFTEKLAGTEDVLSQRIHMMTVRCDEHSTNVPPEIQVQPATAREREILAATIAERWPRPKVLGLDFTPETISMGIIADQWRHAGLERERAIFTARIGGKAVAFGIFEIGQLGTNMFRLLDCARVISIVAAPGAHAALIQAGRRWFASRRRSEFLYYREDADASYVSDARLHEDSEPHLWIIGARHLPDFLEHVCEVAGPRLPVVPQPISCEPLSLRPTDQTTCTPTQRAKSR